MTALWYKNAATCDTSSAVLKSAEKFFFGKDPEEADRLIHCLSEKEPNNPQWANELAQLYRMSGITGRSFPNLTERALYAYDQVLKEDAVRRKLVLGSDWPVIPIPTLRVGWLRALRLLGEKNWLRRDVLIKQHLGFEDAYWHRAASLLRLPRERPA